MLRKNQHHFFLLNRPCKLYPQLAKDSQVSVGANYLNVVTNKVARYIKDHYNADKCKKVVIVTMPACDLFALGLVAASKAGAAFLPLDHEMPADRMTSIIEDVQPWAIITLSSLLPYYAPKFPLKVCYE